MKKRTHKKSIYKSILILIAIILILLTTTSNASGTPTTIDPEDWKPSGIDPSGMQDLTKTSNIIANVLRGIGTIVAVAVLIMLGIKYMIGSTSERAEYKKTMIPYLIGAVMLFGISQILAFIINIVDSVGPQ